MKKLLAVFISFIMIFCNCSYVFAGTLEESCIDSASWMQYLPDDAPISDINLPGSHDAACRYFIKDNIVTSVETAYAKTQYLSVPEQFDAGVRFMDCRICLRNSDDDFLTVPHNMTITADKKDNGEPMTIDMLIAHAEDFVTKHPSESVVLMLANDGRTYDASSAKFLEIKEALIDTFKGGQYPHRKYIDLDQTGNTSPTVGEMRGYVAVVRSGDLHGVSTGCENTAEWKWNNTIKPYFDNDVKVQNYNRTTMNKTGNNSANPLTVNTSCRGEVDDDGNKIGLGIPHPEENATKMNKYIQEQGLKKGYFYGWFQMDFAKEDLNRLIYLTNNFVFDINNPSQCPHSNLQKLEAKDATTTEAGNIECWYCPDCGSHFASDDPASIYTTDDWFIPRKTSGGGGSGSGSGSGSGGGGSNPETTTDPTEEEPVIEPDEPTNSEVIAAVESSKIKKTRLTVKNRKVKLSWKKLTYDYPTQYIIYRSYKNKKSFKKIKTITNGKNSFNDTKKLKKGKKYYYKIVGQIKIDDKWYKTKSSIKSIKLK